MTAKGRPLGVLVSLLSVWVGYRVVAATLPGDVLRTPPVLPQVSGAALVMPTAAVAPQATPAIITRPMSPTVQPVARMVRPPVPSVPTQPDWEASPSPDPRPFIANLLAEPPTPTPQIGFAPTRRRPPTPTAPLPDLRKRGFYMEGSSWVIWRGSAGATALSDVGQLGGSQAGLRTYIGHRDLPFALTALSSTPLSQFGGRYVGVGAAFRRKSVGLIVERRIPLEPGSRAATAITGFAGAYGVRLPAQFRLDGYGQAGAVDRALFAEGAVRAERRFLTLGPAEFFAGLGAWGGVQPGLSRLDAGPQLGLRVPLRRGTMRVSAEWRQRLAGKAAPASGPALSAGVDF